MEIRKGYYPDMEIDVYKRGPVPLREYAKDDPTFMVARLCSLSEEHERWRDEITALEAKVERLREALEFYADMENYTTHPEIGKDFRQNVILDRGKIAREALNKGRAMDKRIEKAIIIWPGTNDDDWRIVGGSTVHKDAVIEVDDSHMCSGIIRSGQVSGNAQVYGDARVYGDAQVYGDARVYGDAWGQSPIYIQGSAHCVSTVSHSEIAVGCEIRSVACWLKHYRRIGRCNNYSDSQIVEYGEILRLVARLLELRFGEALNKGDTDD
ncbi:MAG: hypothetical protein ACTSUU_06800 [Candidatus Thorarchaeota archaeon]